MPYAILALEVVDEPANPESYVVWGTGANAQAAWYEAKRLLPRLETDLSDTVEIRISAEELATVENLGGNCVDAKTVPNLYAALRKRLSPKPQDLKSLLSLAESQADGQARDTISQIRKLVGV